MSDASLLCGLFCCAPLFLLWIIGGLIRAFLELLDM